MGKKSLQDPNFVLWTLAMVQNLCNANKQLDDPESVYFLHGSKMDLFWAKYLSFICDISKHLAHI